MVFHLIFVQIFLIVVSEYPGPYTKKYVWGHDLQGVPRRKAQKVLKAKLLQEPPFLMGSMGDSITAGTFANTAPPRLIFHDLGAFLEAQSEELGSLDSNPELSWSGGDLIESHFKKLGKLLESSGQASSLEVLNISKPGIKMNAMVAQAQALLRHLASGSNLILKYVTLFAGSNDLCGKGDASLDEKAIYDDLMKSIEVLQKIQDQQPRDPIRILVVGIPKVSDLASPDILRAKTHLGFSCEVLRDKIFKTCTTLLNWRTESQYQQSLEIIFRMNRLIEKVVQDAQLRFPVMRFHFTWKLFYSEILMSHLAFDCFHPNKNGQQSISELLWEQQPWF